MAVLSAGAQNEPVCSPCFTQNARDSSVADTTSVRIPSRRPSPTSRPVRTLP